MVLHFLVPWKEAPNPQFSRSTGALGLVLVIKSDALFLNCYYRRNRQAVIGTPIPEG
jgi:hypothetical protein